MALNAAQIARRASTLGGSDIKCLMTGNVEEIHRLWRVKIGEEVPEDLSNVWPVQLGLATEQLNLDWYARKQKQTISRRGDVVTHPFFNWAAVTLDGWIDELQCPIEGKHVSGREPLEIIIERYQPQMQWQMEVTGADQCALSVIMAASEPIVEFIERDVAYAMEQISRGEQFMKCVWERKPPVELPAVPPPIEASKVYEMDGSNLWASAADDWLRTSEAAGTHDDAAKILKSLVPLDAKKCTGHGVYIIRDRAGRLSLREMQ